MEKKIILVLTATISPHGKANVVIKDRDKRLEEYINALSFYENCPASEIHFIENSDADLSNLIQRFKKVEFHQYDSDLNKLETNGKGYSELELLENFISHQDRDNLLFIKITGRLIIKNINVIIKNLKGSSQAVLTGQFNVRKHYCDSRIFAFTKKFFNQYMINRIDEIDDKNKIYLEHILYRAIAEANTQQHIVKTFFHKPRILGVSGSSGEMYDDSYLTFCIKDFRYKMIYLRNYFFTNRLVG